jgi:hypothetical protein
MHWKIIILMLFIIASLSLFSGCLEEGNEINEKPNVEIHYPQNGITISGLVKIFGIAYDLDEDDNIEKVEINLNNSGWIVVEGTINWSYDLGTYHLDDGPYTVNIRCWDGKEYSDIVEITVIVNNPKTMESDSHKWAIFIAAANYPSNNESKLGNGGLNLAEDMAAYFIENYGYSTSNMYILFDDGWIRGDNGYGNHIETLQQRSHQYDINYAGATKENVKIVLNYIIEESNRFADSEVFIWLYGHGYGNENDEYTGGKILESSAVFLWNEMISDRELGEILYDLRSEKTCVIVDACFSGGFADKTIYNFPTFFLMRSNIPNSGRIIISGASKFRTGYASTTRGPLFSLLWFEGIKSGNADGYNSGFREMGKPPIFEFNKDSKVSVEEAFHYASYLLRTDVNLEDYSKMVSQINDQYPRRGILRNNKDMFLGD